jgi:hypothetical protein
MITGVMESLKSNKIESASCNKSNANSNFDTKVKRERQASRKQLLWNIIVIGQYILKITIMFR